jgi:hypothetical protein
VGLQFQGLYDSLTAASKGKAVIGNETVDMDGSNLPSFDERVFKQGGSMPIFGLFWMPAIGKRR